MLSGIALFCFESYLTDRVLYVIVDGLGVCVCVCVCVCVYVCVHVCVHVCMCVHACAKIIHLIFTCLVHKGVSQPIITTNLLKSGCNICIHVY